MSQKRLQARTLEKLGQNDLDAILTRHGRFRRGQLGGARAVLSFFDLAWLDFGGAVLTDADLTGSVLSGPTLDRVILDNASMFASDLRGATLAGARLVKIGPASGRERGGQS